MYKENKSNNLFIKRQKEKSKKCKKDYEDNPKFCKKCKKKIPYEKRNNIFCNSSCSTSYNNKGIVRNKDWVESLKEKKWNKNGKFSHICKHCNKIFKSDYKHIECCSYSCQTKYVHKSKREKWIEEIEKEQNFIGLDGNSSNYRPKTYLIEKYGHKCMVCKIEVWRGKPVPLVFDHIDGDSGNWNFNNCRLVCANCDAQLPTYKSKNKKSSRTKRYK